GRRPGPAAACRDHRCRAGGGPARAVAAGGRRHRGRDAVRRLAAARPGRGGRDRRRRRDVHQLLGARPAADVRRGVHRGRPDPDAPRGLPPGRPGAPAGRDRHALPQAGRRRRARPSGRCGGGPGSAGAAM
ncbi:MAG: hypothetical protein AVDCRST_MAG57-3185, partial [uncultured Blastococcus sp.]